MENMITESMKMQNEDAKTDKKESWTIHPDEIFKMNGLIPKEIHKTGTVVYTIKKVRLK